ncbi:ATP-binding protein [Clostridium sp. Sa3CUN1]|uniref:ATP-binding protein n=1 Tax=Clostridium gallinarum TaxID=2762246 RepID=A0ABR8Q600_9CLOT|nr:GHKL domain-containing protein [Clostridium gallinarum]MBD7915838.1 ATP-binding protein [Clostridium gallinarum]
MKNNYIKFDYNINIPIDFNYDISDISILLGNILDNSIEAVNKLPIKKRYISFFMEYKNKTLFITIKNKFNGRIIKDNNNNNILTSKKDCNKHGLGLLSIKNIVNKYFGEFNVDIKENVFIIKILLFEIN